MSGSAKLHAGPQIPPFPRAPLIAAGILLGGTILVAGLSRNAAGPMPETGKPILSRMIRFEDRADGGVGVIDAVSNRTIQILAPGTNGFVRATVRGLAGKRRRQSLGDDRVHPFRLTAWSDNRLTLDDTASGQRIEVEAFGATNVAAFSELLTAPEKNP